MSVQRFYPKKDAFIIGGDLKDINTGLDEILELGLCETGVESGSARILLDFDWEKIEEVEPDKVLLHLNVSTISNLEENTTVEVYSQSLYSTEWLRGTGHLYDVPNPSDGATWNYPFAGATASWSGSLSSGSSPCCTKLMEADEDLVVDLTEYYTSCSTLVLKLQNEDVDTRISFFSQDTHTIYRPYVETLKDDSVRGEDIPAELSSTNAVISVKNFCTEYDYGDKVRIDLGVRPKYPTRTFSTSSLYLDSNILPTGSYWSIKDEYTGEVAVERSLGTKLSADATGNFFILDTSLLEPERYYRLLVYTDLKGQELTLDNANIFKVKQNVR